MTVFFKSVTAYGCSQCKHEWLPRQTLEQGGKLPAVCPECKSPDWNKPLSDLEMLLEDRGPKLWKAEEGSLVYEVNENYRYDIPVDECHGRPDKVIRWLDHVREKTWASPEVIDDLVLAFIVYANDILFPDSRAKKQAHLREVARRRHE